MKQVLFSLPVVLLWSVVIAQPATTAQLADSARIFGKGVISNGDFVFNASFTPDNKTVFFSKATLNWGYIAIFSSVWNGSSWAEPKAVSFTGVYRDTDPFVSADGKRLYFSSDRPAGGKPFKDYDYHYFYVELDGNKIVSEPKQFELPVPEGMNPAYPSFAANGNIYFFSTDKGDADIYMCAYKNGSYQPPVRLSFNDSKYFDFDPYVAPDESLIAFSSTNRPGYGSVDLWVSFKKDESWTEPLNLGSKVNTKGAEGAPAISRDGKTLYFGSYREQSPRPVYKNGNPTTQEVEALFHSYRNGLRNIYEIKIDDLTH
jgi:Tol biopolymer transport system component